MSNSGSSFPPPGSGQPMPPPVPPPDPGAGAAEKRPWWRRWWVLGIAALVLIGIIVGAFASDDTDDDAQSADDAAVATVESTAAEADTDETAPPSDPASTSEPEATEPPGTTQPVTTTSTTTTTAATTTTTTEATTTTTTTTEVPEVEPVVGESIDLPDGGIARVNAVVANAEPRTQFIQPDPGFSFTDVEVEVCAGRETLSVNPLSWTGFLENNNEAPVALGAQDLETVGLQPGGCARGFVALEVPDGQAVADIVLLGGLFDEVARWSTADSSPVTSPLQSEIQVAAVQIGEPMQLGNNATATVRSVSDGVPPRSDFVDVPAGRKLAEADVEMCAGDEPLSVNPLYWLIATNDNYVAGAELGGQTLPTLDVAAGQCAAGVVQFGIPEASSPTFVLVTGGLLDEAGRTAVG